MFSSVLQTNYIDNVKEHAKKTKIAYDRNLSRELFEDVEKYANNNNVIVSDITMLTTNCCTDNCYPEEILFKEQYNIYCSSPFKHGNNLINIIAERIENSKTPNLSKWLVLRTAIPHKLLSITYKGREFVKIHCLYSQKIKDLNSIIKPVSCKGFYIEENISLLPYEIELIDIYRRLYMPNAECVNKWEDLIEIEPYLVSETNKRIKNKIFTEIKKGGAVDSSTIKQMILFKMLPDSNFVLIGEWAVRIIEWGLSGGNLFKSQEKIQIISETEIKETFDNIKTHIKTILPSSPFDITYREHDLHIPKDLRIKRYTIYLSTPCDKEGKCPVKQMTIMDVFTNASYELIPWISSNRFLKKKNKEYPIIKIGNPYVLLRFFMLDLWILRIIFAKNLLIKNVAQKKIDSIWISINKIRNPNKLGGIINKSFSLENYIGKYHSEIVHFKNIIKSQKIPDYFPYKWKKEMKSYRKIFDKFK